MTREDEAVAGLISTGTINIIFFQHLDILRRIVIRVTTTFTKISVTEFFLDLYLYVRSTH